MPERTPAAEWRAKGEPDPHGERYDCERAQLTMGDLTDDELANAVFMHGNERPDPRDLISGKAKPAIAYLTAAKDRIRWLSRALDRAMRRDQPSAVGAHPLSQKDVFTLIGHAHTLLERGHTDMPRYCYELAERIARSLGNDHLAERVCASAAQHLPAPTSGAAPTPEQPAAPAAT